MPRQGRSFVASHATAFGRLDPARRSVKFAGERGAGGKSGRFPGFAGPWRFVAAALVGAAVVRSLAVVLPQLGGVGVVAVVSCCVAAALWVLLFGWSLAVVVPGSKKSDALVPVLVDHCLVGCRPGRPW